MTSSDQDLDSLLLHKKNLLFDFYGALLTERQKLVFAMRYMEDSSLAEIGLALGITTQAVVDFLKRIDKRLEMFENKLGLVAKFQANKAILARLRNQIPDSDSDLIELIEGLQI